MTTYYGSNSNLRSEIISGGAQVIATTIVGRTYRFVDSYIIPDSEDWGNESSNLILFGPIPNNSILTGVSSFFAEKLGDVAQIRVKFGWFTYNDEDEIVESDDDVYAENLNGDSDIIDTKIGYNTRTFTSPLIIENGTSYFGATVECDETGIVLKDKIIRVELYLTAI